jgi:hypothetical protein
VDGRRFDELLSVLAESGSRRLLIRVLSGTGLAALLSADSFAVPAAADKDDKKRRRKKPKRKKRSKNTPPAAPPAVPPVDVCAGKAVIDNTTCDGDNRCTPTFGCRCARTAAGGAVRCVQTFGEICPTTDECDTDANCPENNVCVQLGGCCEGTTNNACMSLCVT